MSASNERGSAGTSRHAGGLKTEPRLSLPRGNGSSIDLLFAAGSILAFTFWIYVARDRYALGEGDLYRVLVGVVDGARQGSGLESPLHYGKSFSFGYIAALYAFIKPSVLRDAHRLILVINNIGFCAAILGTSCFWLSTRILYGLRLATVSLIVFVFSPMMLDVGTSGHQILIALALFFAASTLFFMPVRGVYAWAASAAGFILLLAALVSRAEVFLAFPFLSLAQADLSSLRQFLKSALIRSVGPTVALIAFFILRHIYVHDSSQSAEGFFDEFYRLAKIPRGLVAYTLDCGIATTLVALFAAVRVARTAIRGASPAEGTPSSLRLAIGAGSLIILPFVFWIANPIPPRHFILCLSGMSMLIGWLLTSQASGRPLATYTAAVTVALANQAFAVMAGPVIMSHYPTKLIRAPGQPIIMPPVPIGSSWAYLQAAKAERSRTNAFAQPLLTTCDSKIIALSENQHEIFSYLYEGSRNWNVKRYYWRGFLVLDGKDGLADFMAISLHEGWPRDVVAEVLADRKLDSYKIARDPDFVSIYDRTPIPGNRLAHLGCKSLSGR